MRFFRGLKITLDTDMKLPVATLEPTPPSRTQPGRLFNLRHAEDRTVKLPRRFFASLRRCDLDVVDSRDARLHSARLLQAAIRVAAANSKVEYMASQVSLGLPKTN
jgi:hypothetical protein